MSEKYQPNENVHLLYQKNAPVFSCFLFNVLIINNMQYRHIV